MTNGVGVKRQKKKVVFGEFYLVSIEFEWSFVYDDKITGFVNRAWWIWQER